MDYKAQLSTATYAPDALVAGNHHLLVGRKITIATGEGELPRGAVIGKVTASNGATADPSDENTGTASIGTITVSPTALDGDYTVVVTAAKDGDTAAKFTVTAPNGATATGSMGVAFSGVGLSFTITDGVTGEGTAPAAKDDSWTIAVVAANGEYRLSTSGASDGSQTPDLILAEPVDATTRDIEALAYERGDFNANALTIGTGHTVASIRDGLRAKGITILPALAA
jgi:hypothetical protein